jgi:hypothetical protein
MHTKELGYNVDTFSIHPIMLVLVDGNPKELPSGVGNETVEGKECLRPIHRNAQGNSVHIEYVRLIRLTLEDFMKIYSPDNMTISVMDNASGSDLKQNLSLSDYDILYSYHSDDNKFTRGLFVIGGVAESAGLINMLANIAIDITGGYPWFTFLMIVWSAGVGSAFVDIIPLTATMIPVIQTVNSDPTIAAAFGDGSPFQFSPLWWALALGADLGGNGNINRI